MAKKLSKAKAAEMLQDGTANGKKLTKKQKRYFGMVAHSQMGSQLPPIEDNMGQWAHPGQVTKINSPNITMKGVDYPVLGISDNNDVKMMFPGQNYKFKGTTVTEYPMAKSGKTIKSGKKKQYGGSLDYTPPIPIEDPTFKNRKEHDIYYTQKVASRIETEEPALYSKYLELSRAGDKSGALAVIMAAGGIPTYNQPKPIITTDFSKIGFKPKKTEGYRYKAGKPDRESITKRKGQYGYNLTGADFLQDVGVQPIQPWMPKTINTPPQTPASQNQEFPWMDVISGATRGIQMLGQEKDARNQAKQFTALSKVVSQAAGLKPDKPKRKYVRPEDQILNPEEIYPTYGRGTNYLAKHGGKYQDGGMFPQLSEMITGVAGQGNEGYLGGFLGSAIGGGKGNPTGAGQIGSTLGGILGSVVPGIGTAIGALGGGLIGGILGGKQRKKTQEMEAKAMRQLQGAAFQQGVSGLHNQYTGFMKEGGKMPNMESGGELQLYDGNVEVHSENPYLPDGGETMMFRGPSHSEGGIPVKFGKSSVEVEGGEPAVKLPDAKGKNNLVVFGDMKIPSYGVSELGDKDAKGKKFKNYIKDLDKVENKQNQIVEKGLTLINETDVIDSFDKLKVSSGKALVEGGNMKLKQIAAKKQIAANVQNAILETAKELNLKPDELAKGNIRKERKGAKTAQSGGQYAIPRSQAAEYELYGYQLDPQDNSRMFRDLTTGASSTTSSVGQPITLPPAKGGKLADEQTYWKNYLIPQLQKGVTPEELVGKGYMSSGNIGKAREYYKDFGQRTQTITNPGRTDRDYIYLQDDGQPVTTTPPGVGTPPPSAPTPPGSGRSGNFDWTSVANTLIPYLRPSNQLALDHNQLSGEMYALATNQLDPVQAQLYEPLLESVSDISLQDQLNANQADFNALQRLTANNPAAQAQLAAQKYQANSGVLGEQFRLNQAQRMGTYNRNRGVLNDATLKNLAILDQQYVRQSQAKSNTKAVAQTALNSISDKIAKNKLENRTLGIYENLHNYRYDRQGRAINYNPLAQFNIDSGVIQVDEQGRVVMNENKIKRDEMGRIINSTDTQRVTSKSGKNGAIVKAMNNY